LHPSSQLCNYVALVKIEFESYFSGESRQYLEEPK